jgi:hypothetical protein
MSTSVGLSDFRHSGPVTYFFRTREVTRFDALRGARAYCLRKSLKLLVYTCSMDSGIAKRPEELLRHIEDGVHRFFALSGLGRLRNFLALVVLTTVRESSSFMIGQGNRL